QMWRSWSRDAAASRAVVGRTLGGILFTGIEFGYIIAFYLIATRLWKWWTPAEVLVDPNILATYVPWLSAVAPSLHAGFWDLSLFALPLFASTAASSRIDQMFVIACGAVPLGVIGWALLRRRQMVELPDSLRNRAWTPPAAEPELEPQVIAAPVAGWSSTRTRVVVALGVVGLVAWAAL